MKAIIITNEIKEKNEKYQIPFVKNNSVGAIVITNFPQKFFVSEPVSGGYGSRTDLHEADGWRDVIQPVLGANQIVGEIYYDAVNDVFTYPVISLTTEQIEANIASASEANREGLIQKRLTEWVMQQFEASTNAEELLENIDVFPLWQPDKGYSVNQKVKFVHEQKLKLYRVNQGHTSQLGWEPPNVPALFTVIAPPGQVLPWVQPLGHHDAYQVGNIVSYNGQNWISTAANNVWEPGVFGWVIYVG
jgi:hypothetical protein